MFLGVNMMKQGWKVAGPSRRCRTWRWRGNSLLYYWWYDDIPNQERGLWDRGCIWLEFSFFDKFSLGLISKTASEFVLEDTFFHRAWKKLPILVWMIRTLVSFVIKWHKFYLDNELITLLQQSLNIFRIICFIQA